MLNLTVYTKLDAVSALDRAAKYFVGQEGFHLVEYVAHFHADASEDAVGHLMVTVSHGDPVEVSFESEELDSAVRAFADGLPRAKTLAKR